MTRHEDIRRDHFLTTEAACLKALGDTSAATIANGILSLIRLGSMSEEATNAVTPFADDDRDVAFGTPLSVFSGAYLELAGERQYSGPLRFEVDRVKSIFKTAD